MSELPKRRRPADDYSDVVTRVGKQRREPVEKLMAALCSESDADVLIRALRDFSESANLTVDRRDALLSLFENIDKVQADSTRPGAVRVAIATTIGATTTIIIKLVELLTSQSHLERSAVWMYQADQRLAEAMPKMTGKSGGDESVRVRRVHRMLDMFSAARAYNILRGKAMDPTLKNIADYLVANEKKPLWPATGGWLGRVTSFKRKNIVMIAGAIRAIRDQELRKHPH